MFICKVKQENTKEKNGEKVVKRILSKCHMISKVNYERFHPVKSKDISFYWTDSTESFALFALTWVAFD